MAMLKYGHASVVQASIKADDWTNKVYKDACRDGQCRMKTAKSVIAKYAPDKYLLSHCFPAGQLILMADGTEKPIEQVKVGDLVITHQGNVKPVTKTISREVSEDLTVFQPSALPETICTGEHPFYAIKKQDSWCRIFPYYARSETVKCTYGGKQKCNKYNCNTNGAIPSWILAKNLQVGDKTYTPTLHETSICDELNPNRMRLLGYYVAEGRVDKQKGPFSRPYMIRFAIHEKEIPTIGAELCKLMELEFGIKTHSVLRCIKSGKGVVLSFHCFKTALWFLRFAGIGSKTKRLSQKVMVAPLAWQRQFMGAWLNGDGNYDHYIYDSAKGNYSSKGIRLSTVSSDLKSQAMVILDRLEIHSNLQKIHTPEHLINFQGQNRHIAESNGWHVSISKSYVMKLSDVVQWDVKALGRNLISTKQRYKYAASTISTILSVSKKFFTGTVYNLSVEDDESYIVNRQAVHNCTIIASVDVDLADPKDAKSGYYIKPEFSQFINNNGDAWSKEVIVNSYKTFIGGENYCFPAGTRILMADGVYKPIEEIKSGDRVINRFGKIDAVSKIMERESENLVEIRGNNILCRSLFVTKDHPFWIFTARNTCPKTGRPNAFDRDANFCQLDSWVGFGQGVHRKEGEVFPSGLTPDWVKASDLDSNRQFLTHPVSNQEIENSEMNENRAELLGWYLAEGCLNKLNKFSKQESAVVFCLGNNELGIAHRLSELLVLEFGKYFRIDCKPRIYEAEEGYHTLSMCNEEAALFFKKWGGRLAWAKKLPEEALWLPKKLQAIILKHCINGDGCGKIVGRGYLLEMKSSDLIQQLNFISWRLGLLPTYKDTGVLSRYSECEIIDGYERYTDPMTDKKSRPGYILRFSTRDSKRLNALLGLEDPVISAKRSMSLTHIFNVSGADWAVSKIDYVRPSDVKCRVYNLEVEGDNSYVAEGVVVHNCEHVQIAELSKGKIIDAALREIVIGKDKDGKDLSTYYVDILVATDRKHEDIVRKIESKSLNSLSMGCLIKFSVCSKCGNRAVDETQACEHIRFQKNNMFFDGNGVQRKIAELCGHKDEPDSVRFVEASWVRQPAFTGAVLRSFVTPSMEIMAKFDEANKISPYKRKPGDYMKAAAELIVSQDPPPPPPPPEAEAPKEDKAPKEEAPEEAPADEAGAPGDEAPGGAAGVPMPEEESDVKVWKKDIKKQVLKQLSDEVMKEFSDEEPSGPRDLETLDETLIRPASVILKKVWGSQKDWNRFVRLKLGNMDKKSFDRLRYGVHMAMTNSDLTVLKDYGYTKRDMVAVLSFLDSCQKEKLPVSVKKTIAGLGGTYGNDSIMILKAAVSRLGRKLTENEAVKVLSWVKLLDFYA